MAAWAKKINSKVYKKSLIILSSVNLGKAKLLFNCKNLSKLKPREDYNVFSCFVF